MKKYEQAKAKGFRLGEDVENKLNEVAKECDVSAHLLGVQFIRAALGFPAIDDVIRKAREALKK